MSEPGNFFLTTEGQKGASTVRVGTRWILLVFQQETVGLLNGLEESRPLLLVAL